MCIKLAIAPRTPRLIEPQEGLLNIMQIVFLNRFHHSGFSCLWDWG